MQALIYLQPKRFGYSGGAGPNSTDNFFLFDPAANQFIFDKELSTLTQTSIDSHT
jgi:hypothetical protein